MNAACRQQGLLGWAPLAPAEERVELLADPAFRSLDDWLRQHQAGAAEVQAAVDQVLEQARQAASE